MLFGFYSGLIIFILLFIVVSIFFIRQIVLKTLTTYSVNTFMLGTLMLFMLILSSIYSYDFYKLQVGETKTKEGSCDITYVNGRGRSIDTTEIVIDKKQYTVKSNTYKNLPDGLYYCELNYLPITKIVAEIDIHK